MSYFLWHTIVDTTANMLAIHDEDKSDLYVSPGYYSPRMRHPTYARNAGARFFTLWPRSRGSSGDPSASLWPMGQESSEGGLFEPLAPMEGGNARHYFVHGTCVDGSGNLLAGAVVELYRTSTDERVCTGQTDSNGIYSLGTPYPGENHYVVANYGPNTYIGASVNTLVPTLSPW